MQVRGPATSVCKAVRLTSERSGHQTWGNGCPRSTRRVTPYLLVGLSAKCPMSTAAVMCRFSVGSLSRVKFDLGGGILQFVQTDRHGEAERRFLWFANFPFERTGAVSICVLFDCVLLDVRTFQCAYFCQPVELPCI